MSVSCNSGSNNPAVSKAIKKDVAIVAQKTDTVKYDSIKYYPICKRGKNINQGPCLVEDRPICERRGNHYFDPSGNCVKYHDTDLNSGSVEEDKCKGQDSIDSKYAQCIIPFTHGSEHA